MVMIKLNKFFELERKMISFNHIYLIMRLDLRMIEPMISVINYMFSIYDTSFLFPASQPIKIQFKFDGVVPDTINGYALVLTNKLVSLG